MEKVITARGLDIKLDALRIQEASRKLNDADFVLLDFLVSYLKDDWAKHAHIDNTIEIIPMMDYGRMYAEKIIDDIVEIVSE